MRENITVNLNVKKAAQLSFKLIDLTGKVVKEIELGEVFGNYKSTINITDLVKGFYFLKINSGNDTEIKKIMIQ